MGNSIAATGLEVLCGLALDAARLTEIEDLSVGQGRIGQAVFGPSGLLRDLELRLGLAIAPSSETLRVARWSTRLAELASRGRFYSRSYEVDAWGTASELLRLRDLLVDAGWEGTVCAGGGERLAQLAELEAHDGPPLPPGKGERLRSVAAALDAGGSPGYARLRIVEAAELWSRRWQQVFAKLGCKIESAETVRPTADPQSDLGRMQRHLLEGGEFVSPRGDGTLVFLRGETVWETAHATANLLRAWEGRNTIVVIRSGNALPLDLALEQAGLPTQGVRCTSKLRPLLQVLHLALELAFEPKDPYRVLELLALPEGPFRGILARHLADALAAMPGLGGETWLAAKERAAELIRKGILTVADPVETLDTTCASEKALKRVAEWIEAPGHPQRSAPRGALLATVVRVQSWLQGQIVGSRQGAQRNDDLLGIAYGQAAALAETLTADPRSTLSLVQVRQLVEAVVGRGGELSLSDETAGRIDHVAWPAALLRPRRTVAWWNCTAAAAEAQKPIPFSRTESAAMEAAGVRLGDARARMAETAASWRRAVLAASHRFVLIAPRMDCGEAIAVHPFWDELDARMGGERRDLARVSMSAHEVLHGTVARTAETSASPLPPSSLNWQVPSQFLARGDRASASSLEVLIGCPLRWTLHYRAGLRAGSLVSLPEDHLLYGALGHRLVELLHKQGAWGSNIDTLRRQTFAILDEILPKEGATLLLPGRRGELAQLRVQLATAVVRLADLLQRSKLEIVDVEKEDRVEWNGRMLEGHLDLLLKNRDKDEAILDLKWGRTAYADKLKEGTALQLAVYAFLRERASGAKTFPAVAYFSLSRGVSLATDESTFVGAHLVEGPDAGTTWHRTEVTLRLVERHLDKGVIPVAGVTGALPIVQACGNEPDHEKHLMMAPDAACQYCDFDPICGRRWEAQR